MIQPDFKIGFLTLHLYGLFIALGIAASWFVSSKRASIYKIPQKLFDDLILVAPIASALIGARLYHVIDQIDAYSQDTMSIFYVSNGGLGIWGGIIGAIVGFWIISKVKKLKLMSLLDLFAPTFLLGQAIGRIGNYINQEGFGSPTNLPWGVYIDQAHRPIQFLSNTHFHPTFFYESILDLLFFILLVKLTKYFKKPGQAFGLYIISYSSIRAFTEIFRIDTWTISTIKISYPLSAIGILIGLYLLKTAKTRT